MRTFNSSQITHWEMSAKAIFESMGIGIHVLYPIALPHILGIRLGVHPFDLYGTNKPMKKNILVTRRLFLNRVAQAKDIVMYQHSFIRGEFIELEFFA
jgi:hypothetical protein